MRNHPFKRTAIVAAASAVATAATLIVPGLANAQGEFVKGSGKAKAQIVRIGPSSGQLSLAPSVGVALADHLGTLGRGESLVVDYAALDGTVQDDLKDQPIDPKGKHLPPLRVESTDEGGAAGRTQRAIPGIVQRARADGRPFGFASAEVEAFDIPGVVHVSGGRAESYSGVIEIETDAGTKTVRQAGGTVDLAEVRIGSDTLGFVQFDGLHWEAFQRTDENDDETPELVGTWSFAKMTVLDPSGERHEASGPTSADIPQEMRDGLLAFQEQTGLALRFPELVTVGGVTRLTPLGVSLIESPVGQQVFAPIQEGFAPVRDEVTRQWLEGCAEGAGEEDAGNCGLPFLVADVAIGPLAGGGRFDVELGGVTGVTEGTVFEGYDFAGFDGGGFDTPTAVETFEVADTPVVAGATATNATPTIPQSGEQPGVVDSGPTEVAAPQMFELTGSRASAAWAVGLVGLGAALTMAATDYRRLRARRRLITPIS